MTEPANNLPTETAHADGAAFDSAELVAMRARWRGEACNWRDSQSTYKAQGKDDNAWYCGLIAGSLEGCAKDLESVVGRACLATDPELSREPGGKERP